MASFEAIEHRHAQVVIYQDEAKRLSGHAPRSPMSTIATRSSARCGWTCSTRAWTQGYFRPDIDVDLVYRFIRDTTWVSVRWYQPGGPLTAEQVGRQYLSIVLGGITAEPPKGAKKMPEAYVIDAVRTAIGKRNGSLAGVHPVDLGAAGWRGIFDRVDVDPGAVDDVIVGCVDAIGAQAGNIARTVVAGRAATRRTCPESPSTGSAAPPSRPVHFAAQAIVSGTADLVVAGGVEMMSQVPISSAMIVGEQAGSPRRGTTKAGASLRRPGGLAVPWRRADRREVGRLPRGDGTVRAHQPPAGPRGARRRTLRRRDHPGRRTSPPTRARATPRSRRWRDCKPLSEDGRLTAAVASQISDGASAVLLASEDAVRHHGLTPRARVHHVTCSAPTRSTC